MFQLEKMLDVKLLHGPLFVFVLSFSSLISAQTLIPFNTKGLPKARGLDITIKHPADWKIDESSRPNIVVKFTKITQDSHNLMMLLVADVSPSDIRRLKNSSLEDWQKMNTVDNTKATKVTKVRLEGEDAYIVDVNSIDERMNLKGKIRAQILQMLFKDKLISMNCGVIKSDKYTDLEMERAFKAIENDCLKFFNSLVLVQKYQ